MRKFKKKIILFIICMFTVIRPYIAYSENGQIVDIETTSDTVFYDPNIQTNIKIKISNPDIINDKCYLSYHIFDENNNQILWEGDRKKIDLDKNGEFSSGVDIDLSEKFASKKYNKVRITFDIVDESNSFWFSTNPDIKLNSGDIIYEDNFSKRFIKIYDVALKERPVILLINLIVFVIFLVIANKMYKFNRSVQKR